MAPPDLPSPSPSPRIPKLAVRGRDAQPIASSPGAKREDDISPIPSSPRRPVQLTSPPPPTRTDSAHTAGSDRSNPDTVASTASPKSAPKAPKKKSGGSIFGFLTLKEPSSSALEQYAEQQRKLAAGKGGRVTAVGLPGVSTQKLPPTVPKVNSKWDGLPETAKAKDSAKSSNDRSSKASFSTFDRTLLRDRASSRSSGSSSATTFSSSGSRNPPPSLASVPRLHLTNSTPDSLMPSTSSRESRPRESFSPISPVQSHTSGASKRHLHVETASTASLPEISYFFPPDTPAAEQKGQHQSQSNATPPELSPVTPRDMSPLTLDGKPSLLGLPSLAQLSRATQDKPAINPIPTEIIVESSGPAAVVVAVPPGGISTFPKGFLAGEAQELRLSDDEDTDDTSSFTSSETQRRSFSVYSTDTRRPSYAAAVEDDRPVSRQTTDTILAASGPSTADTSRSPTAVVSDHSSIADSLSELSIDLSFPARPLFTDGAASIAGSVAPSEISDMSAQWYRSPRERLGLGGTIRRADVLPWEVANYSQPDLVPAPLAPTRPAQQKKRNRLSVWSKR